MIEFRIFRNVICFYFSKYDKYAMAYFFVKDSFIELEDGSFMSFKEKGVKPKSKSEIRYESICLLRIALGISNKKIRFYIL